MNGKPVFSVPSKTVINFKSGFGQKLLCDDLTFTTGTACAFSCSFCFVPAAMKKQESWLREHGVVGEHEDIVVRRENPVEIARRQLKNAKNKDKPLVIYASPLVDVAANMELVRETVEMCKLILEETNWHIRLLSKSNLLPKVAQALKKWDKDTASGVESKFRVIYGVSTGTLDDKLAMAFEEGCPLVSKRIQSLRWLQDNGFRTFGMVCPSLPQTSYLKFAQAMAESLRYDRCEHVWAEVINVRGDSFVKTIAALLGGGYSDEAASLTKVYHDPMAWEGYARQTFCAHKSYCPPEKLRFLQYVTKDTEQWWTQPGVVKL